MKIAFQVSQTTNLAPEVVNELILLKLRDKKYDILEVTNNSVNFHDNPWVMRWTHQQVNRLDGGVFTIDTIDTIDSYTSVTLKYYLNLLQPLIGISIPVVATIIFGAYEGTLFFIVFVIIALFVQSITSKNVANNMLMTILNEDESD